MSVYDALNKLTKWRSVFAGWQLGTRLMDDPESQAVRDHREVTLLLRAEVSALVFLLIEKGVFSGDEWERRLETEALELDKLLEKRFPGISTGPDGVHFDLPKAAETMKGWKP